MEEYWMNPNKQGEQYPLKSGLLKIAETGKANFRFTCNQNLIVSDVLEKIKQR